MSITPEQQKQKEEAELQRKLADLKARYEAGEITKTEYDKQVKALKKGKGGLGTVVLIVVTGLGLGGILWYEFLRKKPSTATTTQPPQFPAGMTTDSGYNPYSYPTNPYSYGTTGATGATHGATGATGSAENGGGGLGGGGGGGGVSFQQAQQQPQPQPVTPTNPLTTQQLQQNNQTAIASYQQAVNQRNIMNTQLQQQYQPNAIAQGIVQPFQNPYYGAAQISSPTPVPTAVTYQGSYVYTPPAAIQQFKASNANLHATPTSHLCANWFNCATGRRQIHPCANRLLENGKK